MNKAFTIIELLIVAAIIGILLAAAVPNYLLVQTRSKVARIMSDYHSSATAFEVYHVDYSLYPAYGNPLDYALFAGEAVVFVPTSITTPVTYMTKIPIDVFPGKRTGLNSGIPTPYFYMHDYAVTYLGKAQSQGHVEDHYYNLTGSRRSVDWTIWSFGPDLDDDHGILLYDPSNGVVSNGDCMTFGP